MNRRTASRTDTRRKFKYALLALISLILLPLAVVHASPPLTDSVYNDYEQWRRDHPRPAGKAAQELNEGEPRTVRMIYLLPNDRPYRQSVVDLMKVRIREVQSFYAEQMQAHGYGRRTFRFEIDAQGEPLVHRVDGQYPDRHYLNNDSIDAIYDQFWDVIFPRSGYISANVYLIVIDNSENAVISGRRRVGGVAGGGKDGGIAVVPSSVPFGTVAHELGHTFGLHHDFRDDAYIMSYGYQDRLSACATKSLSVNPYLNFDSPLEEFGRPTIKLISPTLYPVGSTSVSIQLKVSDSEGIHQVLLLGWSGERYGIGLKACRGLASEKDAVVEFEYDVTIPSFSSFGHLINVAAIDTDGNESVYDFNLVEISPYQIATLTGHRGWVSSVAFSPDGATLASGDFVRDSTVRLWDVASRQNIATLTGHRGWVSSVAFSPDGTTLASGSRDSTVRLWDVASRQNIATLEGHSVYSVAFSPDGTTLASGGRDGTIALWDVASRRNIATLTGHEHWSVSSVAFSPDGTLLASLGEQDSTIRLWDVASRRNIATLEGHVSPVYSVAFSPDGALLASGGSSHFARDSTVRLWDVASRQNIATLTGHLFWVSSVAFSPDGTLLASGSPDGTVRLWDVASRRNIATFGNPSYVLSVTFSPDGTTLASGSRDGTIALWDVSEVEPATPQTLTKVSGDSQQGPANTRLAKPFVVSVSDQDGSPLSRVRVAFSVTAGGGLLSPTSDADPCAAGSSASSIASYTNANGQASVRLTLGSEPGTNTVRATVEGLDSVTFTATSAEQAVPHRLAKVCGDSQEGIAGEQLAEPFVVSVSDENGAAIAGVAVSFSVTAGGGTLSSATATTDANGRAATRLTLGSEAGANTVTGTVEGLGSVTFTATGQEPPTSLFDILLGGGKLASLPDRTQLLQNAPNPFNSQTVFAYFLHAPGPARVEVFALTGQRVAVLHQGPQQAGYHRLHWDGRDDAGRPVASGMYLYRLVTDETVLTRKLILLR